MDDLLTRGYEAADAPALTDLVNLLDEHAGGHPGATVDEIGGQIATMVREPASDSRLLFTPEGSLVAAGLITTPPDGGYRIDIFGGVHPQWRGRGIGRELLAWQLDRAAGIHRGLAPEATWEAHAGAILGDDAERLYRRFGMTAVRYWFDMVAPTALVPAADLPEGIVVTSYSPEHEKTLHATHMEAFADHWGFQHRDLDDWANLTVRQDDFLPEMSLIAFDGDELVGYVLAYNDADPERLYIGQVGVRPRWRRRGLAGALMAQVIGAGGRAGRTTAYLGVDADSPTGAVGVYERVGFEVEARAVTYSMPLHA